MLNYDANNSYSIINARHQDLRHEAEARRLAQAAQADQPGRIRSAVKGIVRFARHLNQQTISQPVTETQVRLSGQHSS